MPDRNEIAGSDDVETSVDFDAATSIGVDTMLHTSRLLLRPYRPSDASVIERLLNDKEIASNTRSIDYPYPRGGAEKWLKSQNALRLTGDAYVFATCIRDPNAEPPLIGAVGLEINKLDHSAEIGYWIGREFWNQGFCTEACRPVLEFAFETLGLRRVTSHHLARNPASGRVLEKLGMTREGLRRKHVRKWGVFEDVVIYGMLSEDDRL